VSKKNSKIWKEIIGYKPIKTTLPKPKKVKAKTNKRWKWGCTYDPTPDNFGKQYDPMSSIREDTFKAHFLRSLKII